MGASYRQFCPVSKAMELHEIFTESDADDQGGALAAAQDAASGASTGLAYIEMLRYAPCIVPFEDRALVFQELIERDKAVRIQYNNPGVCNMDA